MAPESGGLPFARRSAAAYKSKNSKGRDAISRPLLFWNIGKFGKHDKSGGKAGCKIRLSPFAASRTGADRKNPVRENSLFLRRPPVFCIAAGGKTGYICADNAALYDFAQIILRRYDLRRALLCRALLCRAVLYRLLFCGTALCPVILCRAVLRRTISCGTVLCGALLLLTSAKGMWESLCCRGGEPASLCRV